MFLSENIWLISFCCLFVGVAIYCIRKIDNDADSDDNSISELLV